MNNKYVISLFRGRLSAPGLGLFGSFEAALRGIEDHVRHSPFDGDLVLAEVAARDDLGLKVFRPSDPTSPVTVVELWAAPDRPASIVAIYRILEVLQLEPAADPPA